MTTQIHSERGNISRLTDDLMQHGRFYKSSLHKPLGFFFSIATWFYNGALIFSTYFSRTSPLLFFTLKIFLRNAG